MVKVCVERADHSNAAYCPGCALGLLGIDDEMLRDARAGLEDVVAGRITARELAEQYR